ncbi:MAG: ABC transporter substrate-binding protein [Acidimicrobiaceae bacterium]|jgi:ABC-type transport system substrate-binding protein|nr:ABC transporter substrate-binding protein [Ilumatobacteraceae bacterium]
MKFRALAKKQWTRKISGAVLLALAATLMVSCGSDSANEPTPQQGGNIKVGIFDTFPGFCIGNNPANSALMATRTMLEPLFEKSADGRTVGLLAKSGTPSADLKTWTIVLREGITFHDATTFNAEAVVKNFAAITGQVAAGAFAQSGLAGLQSKSHTIGTATAFTANIIGFRAVSEYEVEFTLDRPQYDFLATLYASGRFVMRSPRQLEDAETCAQKPIGTGPFSLKSWNPSQLVVVKNPNYWRTDPDTNQQLPYLDQITFDLVAEGAQRSNAVRTGTYAASFFSAAADAVFIKDLRENAGDTTEFASPTEYYPSLWLNQGKPNSPFTNTSARQAVLSCLDRKSFNDVRLKGEGDVATSIVGSANIMYNQSGFPKYDVNKAKSYVEQYKRDTGKNALSFVFPVDTSLASQANGRFLKSMWSKCNIVANYSVEQTALTLSKIFNPSPNIAKGQFYNSYDAVFLTLFEGDDAAFNIPFIVTNAYPTTSTNPVRPLFQSSLGRVLGLNHHADTAVDDYFYAGQARADKDDARDEFRKGTEYLQKNSFMGAMASHYYSLFTAAGIEGIGKLDLPDQVMPRKVTNWGIDWTGVYRVN